MCLISIRMISKQNQSSVDCVIMNAICSGVFETKTSLPVLRIILVHSFCKNQQTILSTMTNTVVFCVLPL